MHALISWTICQYTHAAAQFFFFKIRKQCTENHPHIAVSASRYDCSHVFSSYFRYFTLRPVQLNCWWCNSHPHSPHTHHHSNCIVRYCTHTVDRLRAIMRVHFGTVVVVPSTRCITQQHPPGRLCCCCWCCYCWYAAAETATKRCGDSNKLQTPFASISLQTVVISFVLHPGQCLVILGWHMYVCRFSYFLQSHNSRQLKYNGEKNCTKIDGCTVTTTCR